MSNCAQHLVAIIAAKNIEAPAIDDKAVAAVVEKERRRVLVHRARCAALPAILSVVDERKPGKTVREILKRHCATLPDLAKDDAPAWRAARNELRGTMQGTRDTCAKAVAEDGGAFARLYQRKVEALDVALKALDDADAGTAEAAVAVFSPDPTVINPAEEAGLILACEAILALDAVLEVA